MKNWWRTLPTTLSGSQTIPCFPSWPDCYLLSPLVWPDYLSLFTLVWHPGRCAPGQLLSWTNPCCSSYLLPWAPPGPPRFGKRPYFLRVFFCTLPYYNTKGYTIATFHFILNINIHPNDLLVSIMALHLFLNGENKLNIFTKKCGTNEKIAEDMILLFAAKIACSRLKSNCGRTEPLFFVLESFILASSSSSSYSTWYPQFKTSLGQIVHSCETKPPV